MRKLSVPGHRFMAWLGGYTIQKALLTDVQLLLITNSARGTSIASEVVVV